MIFELAGVAGVLPWGLTLRELVWMAKGKQKCLWDIASVELCLLFNVNSTRKHQKKPADFNPFSMKKQKRISITQLKMLLGDGVGNMGGERGKK